MAIKLKDAISLNENEIISLVGGGGKTTLLLVGKRALPTRSCSYHYYQDEISFGFGSLSILGRSASSGKQK